MVPSTHDEHIPIWGLENDIYKRQLAYIQALKYPAKPLDACVGAANLARKAKVVDSLTAKGLL